MRNILYQLKRNPRQLTILIVCITGIVCILLLLGNRFVQENILLKGILFMYILSSFLYFAVTYRRQIIPELKKYLQDSIRKRNPNVLFPGDEGYEEARNAQRQKNKGLTAIKSTQNEDDNE